MLNDKPSDRWELEDLLLWIDGRRLSPIKQKLTTKATRAFLFADRQHATVYELANSLPKTGMRPKNLSMMVPLIIGLGVVLEMMI